MNRRWMIASGLFALGAFLFGSPHAWAEEGMCAKPVQMQGFKTCADVAKAEQEGAVVIYSPDPESNTAALLDQFHAAFPKIKTSFIRLQTGALYQKLMTERRAQTYQVDVLQLTDVGYALDFQKRKGWVHYVSPEMAAYKPDFKSQPEGYWTWGSLIIAGIAYNPNLVKPEDAPKSWKDALDKKWAGVISAKVAASGLEHVTWYELKKLYGDDYWNKFAELKPRVFDSYVQQFDRLVSGQDSIAHTGQYSAYLQFKAKGAPVGFVFPTEGVTVTPGVWGVVADTPHPEAAKLFMDWLLSAPGQTAYDKVAYLSSPRPDAAPPPGGKSTGEMKLLYPSDWQDFLATTTPYQRQWAHVSGVP
ncbi:MAG TPA: extracellular solute-binding protein [Rhodopila sp.]|uniref:ABC transporter substrate-binding protein n=1 Tax=Rhodopila sp. TaxID=2480087 RepID=UPI002C776F94|nr:extracellular solute-binding protein [Rhodopila sp.]HVY14946.1 extracellular solute-binding protein [Rhodopila sp.]